MITVSTSGFSYKDWHGPFYPQGLKAADQLPYFASVFKAVELNYSYYSFPGEKGIAGHLRNAPAMSFALKGHSSFTHTRQYGERELDVYQAALSQLQDNDALICLLLQFPYSFHFNTKNLAYLEKLIRNFEKFPMAIEFRHANWKNTYAFGFVKESGKSLVTTDAPALNNLFRGGWESIGPFGYVRLHGRNQEKWWEHDEGWERYNYLYSPKEIEGMAEAVSKLQEPQTENKKLKRDVYVFFNNHWQAQGAINALQLSQKLGQPLPENFPEDLKKLLVLSSGLN